uniref:Uncharacterized protein n=1 Tax=Tetraselmis sp. GSL018 TaxID=582737 RepID=A0A061R1K8_9CHLO
MERGAGKAREIGGGCRGGGGRGKLFGVKAIHGQYAPRIGPLAVGRRARGPFSLRPSSPFPFQRANTRIRVRSDGPSRSRCRGRRATTAGTPTTWAAIAGSRCQAPCEGSRQSSCGSVPRRGAALCARRPSMAPLGALPTPRRHTALEGAAPATEGSTAVPGTSGEAAAGRGATMTASGAHPAATVSTRASSDPQLARRANPRGLHRTEERASPACEPRGGGVCRTGADVPCSPEGARGGAAYPHGGLD